MMSSIFVDCPDAIPYTLHCFGHVYSSPNGASNMVLLKQVFHFTMPINSKSGDFKRLHYFVFSYSKLKTISSCCLLSHENHLLLGTEGGNVHFFDVATFTLSDRIISHDLIAQRSVLHRVTICLLGLLFEVIYFLFVTHLHKTSCNIWLQESG